MYSTQKHLKKGWFAYNGLWNNGKATFVGLKPLFLEKESLYLLMFEQSKTKHPTILSNPCVTFYKSIHSNNQEIIKESDPPKSLCALTYVQTPFSGHPKLRISSLEKVILLHRAVTAQSSLYFHINIFVVYCSFCTVYYLWTIATFRTVIEWDSVPVQKFLRRNGDESSQDGTSTEARRNQMTQIARVNV